MGEIITFVKETEKCAKLYNIRKEMNRRNIVLNVGLKEWEK